MLVDIATFLASPLNQLLVAVPLSIIGNLSTDAIKLFSSFLVEQKKLEDLEEVLFQSFLKALEIHQSRYDFVARNETQKLKKIAIIKKAEFLLALKCFESSEDYQVPAKLDDEYIRQVFTEKIIKVFKENIPEEKLDLVKAITRDTCLFYREAFFQEVSQKQQLWMVFRESLKIESISNLIKNIQQNIITREEFETLRAYIVKHESTPENIQELKRRYLDYLERKFSSIELTGVSPRVRGQDISFDLEEIFIPFNIEGDEITKNTFTISRNDLSKYTDLFKKDESLSDKIELLKSLERFSQIVLLGEPGGGKTTLLKYITYQMCKFQRQDKYLPSYVPIFLRISEYAQVLKSNPSKRLLDYLLNDYDKDFAILFRWAFENCQVLLLLDGLDEVLDASQRLKVVEQVQDIVARMPENRYIVTSRIIGYDRARVGNSFKHFTIQKFNRQQIKAFCCSWYKAVAKNSLQDINSALSEAEKLYYAIINKKEIENLACNPLMITLIANIHFKGQNLPYSRVQLYDIATETLLQYWVQHRVIDEGQLKDKDDVVEILSPVAFYIHANNPEGVIAEQDFYEQCQLVLARDEYALNPKDIRREIKELIKFLREQSGFFHEKGTNESTEISFFGFLHQTFQEYFTAIEIVNLWKEGEIDFYNLLQDLRWTESFRLAAGILSTEKGRSRKRSTTQFAEDILNIKPFDDSIYTRAVLLVALILVDNIDLTPQTQERFFGILFNTWSINTDKKANEEIEKHITLLLQSKYKNFVWEKIKSVIEQDKHPLHLKLPKFMIRHYNQISELKDYFIQLLGSSKPDIYTAAWEALKEYAHNAEMALYYEVQQYGSLYDLPYNPLEGYTLVSYSSFKEILKSIPEESFSKISMIAVDTLRSCLWIFYTPDGYQDYSTENLVSELKKVEFERLKTLLLLLLIKQNDLLEFESSIQEVLQGEHSRSQLFEETKHKVTERIFQLKRAS